MSPYNTVQEEKTFPKKNKKIAVSVKKHSNKKKNSWEDDSFQYWLDKFVNHLIYDKNVSDHTIENYTHRLNNFIKCVGNISVHEIKQMHILDFRIRLAQQGLAEKTVNYNVIALRSFCKFLAKNDIETIAPEKIELAKIPPRQVSYLLEEEIMRLMEMPFQIDQEELKQRRDFAILQTLFGTGLRVSELINLKISDINLWTKQFSVIGKGKKMRSIFLTNHALFAIQQYLSCRSDTSEYLFISLAHNAFGKALTRNSVEKMIKDYAIMAGINKKVTPHTLRHSFATTLLKNGADIRSVQQLLGHSSIMTTQIYTHVDDKYLQEVHNLLEKNDH